MDSHLEALITDQSGTVARRQLIARGVADHEIRRWVRRRELAPLMRGVYINHTGSPTWLERAWGAVLVTSSFDRRGDAHGSALARESALRLLDGPGSPFARHPGLHVIVADSRFITPPDVVQVQRCRQFAAKVPVRSGIPCVRYEEALIDVAIEASRWDSFALLAAATGSRRTTAGRVGDALTARPWVPQRRWLEQIIADIESGTCSVLERGFAVEVLRAHGLPAPRRQYREVTPIGVVYRDAVYSGLVIELDGRAHHSSVEGRDADLDRDLVAATLGHRTVRLGWGQVFRTPCRTAAALAALIDARPNSCQRKVCRVSASR